MTQPEYAIRTMSRAEIGIAVQWAADEGWDPGPGDADCFHAADAGGFLVGLLNGEPIACISVVRYEPDFGFLGFYIVRPEQRGKGYGLAIWNAGMQRLQGLCVGLDGVPAQQANYRKSGFNLAWRNIRFEGQGPGTTGGARADGLVPLASVPFSQVCTYDRRFFPAERSTFLRAWIAQPGSTALGLVDNGLLTGWGMVRPCQRGYKIGPLFADRPAGARTLFEALARSIPAGEPLLLDLPETNPEALALARDWGMSPCFETARMYTGHAPQIDVSALYGVTSFELG